MHALLERHGMASPRCMAREPLIPFFHLLFLPHLLPVPKQPHPKPTPRNDVQARGCRIRVHILYPHTSFPIPIIPPSPSLDHLLRLLHALLPYDGVASLVESAATDFPVVAPGGAFGGDDVGAEMLHNAVVLNRLHPISATESNLVDQSGRGVGEIKTARGHDEESVAMDGKGVKAFLIGPNGVEDTEKSVSRLRLWRSRRT